MSRPKAQTRIQQKNSEAILEAALEVFSQQGFRGATLDQIAEGEQQDKQQQAELRRTPCAETRLGPSGQQQTSGHGRKKAGGQPLR